jgi:error-prone DNA polymerase
VIQHVYEKYGEAGRGDDGQRDHLPRPQRGARGGEGAVDLEPAQVDRLAKVMHHFEWRRSEETLERNLREPASTRACRVRTFGGSGSASRTCRGTSASTPAAWCSARGAWTMSCRSRTPACPGRVVVQWDKDDCADMGIIKVDLLGLGHDGGAPGCPAPDEHRRPIARRRSGPSAADDPVVYRMLQEADTIGIFQVESRAQMATLPRLKPTCFYDIVVEVAIIRPGPIVGQMVHPYLNRRGRGASRWSTRIRRSSRS